MSPIRNPASGGPDSCPANRSVAQSAPLARSSCGLSTTSGRKVCAVLSRKTSADPKRNARAASARIGPVPGGAVSASPHSATDRTSRAASAARIRRRWSCRSVNTPAGRANSAQGRWRAAATNPISKGSSVSIVASHGTATAISPSPRFVAMAEENNSRKFRFTQRRPFIARPCGGNGPLSRNQSQTKSAK